MAHLPMDRTEMAEYGWAELDFLFISGDAAVDHPSFGAAILTRLLVDSGYRVGIIAQPDCASPTSLLAMGRPRLAVLLSSGVVDSMVNHYTAARKRRSLDVYSPGGQAGLRPDRALIRYGQMVRSQLGDVPLIIGGVEASLRRFAHYDYWSGKVRRSILQDCPADLAIYGQGEQTLLQVAGLLARGADIRRINALPGTALLASPDRLPKVCAAFICRLADYRLDSASRTQAELTGEVLPTESGLVMLPDLAEVTHDRVAYAVASRYQHQEQDPQSGRILIQKQDSGYLVQNPPAPPPESKLLDRVYELPYERSAHPRYGPSGVPALAEVRFSLTSHRGCYGGCHFCAIALHQGRIVRSRSAASLLREASGLTGLPGFKGYIHDVGGPTANFYGTGCAKQQSGTACRDRACLVPEPCPALRTDHGPYGAVLDQIRALPDVKKVFIRSGIRFDTLIADRSGFFEKLCRDHISGQLKVAPEHCVPAVLEAMGKPGPSAYQTFVDRYQAINAQLGLRQYLVPYLISGHPGCTLADAVDLAATLQASQIRPEQVQDFYPTPGTISTTQYYTGLDPFTLDPVHVPDAQEKKLQRALLQPNRPENRALVALAMQITGKSLPLALEKQGQASEEAKHDHPRKRTSRKAAPADRRRRRTDLASDPPATRSGRHPGRR